MIDLKINLESILDYEIIQINRDLMSDVLAYRGLRNYAEQTLDSALDRPEILACVTMYNEHFKEFHRTMLAINKNLETFHEKANNSELLSVLVVADGLEAFLRDFDQDSIDYYKPIFDPYLIFNHMYPEDSQNLGQTALNVGLSENQDERLNFLEEKSKFFKKNFHKLKGKEAYFGEKFYEKEFAHLFISQVTFGDCRHSLKVYFCVKHLNKKKLNSHLWYFAGFCFDIKPKFCLLLDAGTSPGDESIYLFYKAFKRDSQVAGVCGEIIPQSSDESLFDVLGNAQKVEYKFSHILDKSLESLFGYISVLPGAFCAFRYTSLLPDDLEGPLWGDYFKSIMCPDEMNCYNSNIYLAEDRVLCLSLFTCKGHKNLLQYVPNAVAYTDPPGDYETLLSQRRRWTNGSWFGLIDSILNSRRVFHSSHHWFRKLCFCVQTLYSVVGMAYSYILVGLFYAAITMALRSYLGLKDRKKTPLLDPDNLRVETAVENFVVYGYVVLIIVVFFISIGSRIRDSGRALWVVSTVFSGYMALFLMMITYNFQKQASSPSIFIPSSIIVGSFVIVLLLNHCLLDTILGLSQLLIMTPTYINIFTIYSVCNIHDCSWGNRPAGGKEVEVDKSEDYELYRTKCVIFWVVINLYIALTLDNLDAENQVKSIQFIYYFGIVQLTILFIKILGGIVFIVKNKIMMFSSGSDSENLNSLTDLELSKLGEKHKNRY